LADVGKIIEIAKEDGQLIARIDCDWGQQITATIQQSSGVDFYPLAGDRVVFHRTGGSEIVITAIFSGDSEVDPGEFKVASRNQAGTVSAVFHLKADGSIAITNGTGKTVNVGGASGFVAMAQGIDLFLTTLCTSVAPGGTPVVTPTPGASCPVAAAVYAAMMAAFTSSTSDCGSTNLKAD
jgi:hypothetical protein